PPGAVIDPDPDAIWPHPLSPIWLYTRGGPRGTVDRMLDRRDFLQLVAAAAASACTSRPHRAPIIPSPPPADDGRHHSAFLLGRWNLTNQRLRTRLKGDTRWDEFTSVSEVHPILGGLGNTDTYAAVRFWDGKPLQGATLRLFNPATGLWSIYWADDRRVTL